MNQDVVKRLVDSDFLLTPDAKNFLESLENAGEVADELVKQKVVSVTIEAIREILKKKEEEKVPIPVEVCRSNDFKPTAKEFEPDLRLLPEKEVTGKSTCTGTVDDFVFYFRDRFKKIERMLLTHQSRHPLVQLSALKKDPKGGEIRIIGMVVDKKLTKNGHLLVDLESEDGTAKVLFLKSASEPQRTVFHSAGNILLDDIISIEGRYSDPFVMASQVYWPDVPPREPKRSERDVCIAFTSDVHVGSKNFLEDHFRKFLSWLKGCGPSERDRELAGKIKYLFIAGDAVDGVGVYPSQENELVIPDIFAQYQKFFELLSQVPDYIEIVVIPGNHDGVRRAEPQPAFGKDFVKDFSLPNVHFLGNPCQVDVEGLRALLYHGTSLDSIISSVQGLTYDKPEKPMVELLKRRSLSPIYGENPIVPEKNDFLVIDEAPDILHMGHLHKNGADRYRGTFVINSGTWQARTDFQARMGHVPTPCLLPVYNLNSLKLDLVDFKGDSNA